MIKITLMLALVTVIATFAESANARTTTITLTAHGTAACTADIPAGNGRAQIATKLEHDPEKWERVFGQDHAPTKGLEA